MSEHCFRPLLASILREIGNLMEEEASLEGQNPKLVELEGTRAALLPQSACPHFTEEETEVQGRSMTLHLLSPLYSIFSDFWGVGGVSLGGWDGGQEAFTFS